ncbi:MAG: hypothetical protein ACI9H6_000037 [Patiriisocius sp.]|jgi:hypothetical protein
MSEATKKKHFQFLDHNDPRDIDLDCVQRYTVLLEAKLREDDELAGVDVFNTPVPIRLIDDDEFLFGAQFIGRLLNVMTTAGIVCVTVVDDFTSSLTFQNLLDFAKQLIASWGGGSPEVAS